MGFLGGLSSGGGGVIGENFRVARGGAGVGKDGFGVGAGEDELVSLLRKFGLTEFEAEL